MNNLSMLRSYIRLIIESIPSGGHGVMTTAQMGGGLQAHPEDTQFSYEDTDGVDIDMYSTPDGKTHVQINVIDDERLTSPIRQFSNEEEAKNFSRKYVEKIKRIMMSKER